jgi:hypothetical protein
LLGKINCLVMKNKMLKYQILILLGVGLFSCTKLDETLYGAKSLAPASGGAATPGSLAGVYNGINAMVTDQGDWYGMEEHSTDELLGPTRGTDWDDFGTWRKLHLHTWDGNHNQVNTTWNVLNGPLFSATLLAETASGQTKAEAQFLRAFFAFYVCDLYGQVPYRAATDGPDVIPKVFSRKDAVAFILTDLDAAIAALPSYTVATRGHATKEAAEFLEAKVYLNKAVYSQDPTSPAGPYTFDAADMNKVIALANAVEASGFFSVSPYYWDNFSWLNGTKSTEIIFSRLAKDGANVRWSVYDGFHYNQLPSGWNGFTTLSDFYNSFDPNDVRRGDTLAGYYTTGVNSSGDSSAWKPGKSYSQTLGYGTGMLVGQQYGPSGGKAGNAIVPLKDRSGNPLIFTPDVSLFFSTESKGIRFVKYPLDPENIDGSNNDFVFFRYSDLRLMKAEAILRGGTDAETPLDIVNSIRTARGVAAWPGGTTVALNPPTFPNNQSNTFDLLTERGRELYLEAWRRNDLVRYGLFNQPNLARPSVTDGTRVVYAIPTVAVSTNPNLKQNVGY